MSNDENPKFIGNDLRDKDGSLKRKPPGTQKIEKLEQRLYSPNEQFGLKDRKKLQQEEHTTQRDWGNGSLEQTLEAPEPKKRLNLFVIFAVVAFLFFAVSVGYAAFTFFGGGQTISSNDVEISVIGPVSIGGGEELSLDIVVQNNNQTALETVDLLIEYPDGTKKADDLKSDLPRIREGLGIVNPNSVVKRTHTSALFGEEGTQKEIEVTVEYRLPGSNAIFEKKKTFDIILQSSPIRLSVDTVREITPSQELVFEVELGSNSNQTLENVMVVVDYPFGFTLESADYETYEGDNIWLFKELKPQETIRFEIEGRLEGQDTEERVFDFEAGIQNDQTPTELGVVFTTLPKAITISRPFLDVRLSIDGDTNQNIVKAGGEQVDGKITYTNNTDTNIQDAKIVLRFNGAVLDQTSVRASDGFYQSGDNTIIWDRTNTSALQEILAGDTGTLGFTFRSKSLDFNASLFKNPELTLDIEATGKRISETNVPEQISSNEFKRIQFATDVTLQPTTQYASGQLPPKVGSQTTYDIVLNLKNSSADIRNGRVTTTLPNYVRWDNVVSSSAGSVSFDSVSREVLWNIAQIPAHAGYTGGEYKMSFRVTLTPSISQKSFAPDLTGSFGFSGLDTFTERNVQSSGEGATTNIQGGDSFFNSRVTE